MPTTYHVDDVSTDSSSFYGETVPVQILIPEWRGLSDRRKSALEYHWGLQLGELDLTASHNFMQVRADFAPMMLARGLYFSPTMDTLKSMIEDTTVPEGRKLRLYTEKYPVKEYEYKLIPLDLEAPLFLRNPDTSDVQTFYHPYDDLPIFRSSAHPFHLAFICNAIILSYSKRLETLYPAWGESLWKTFMKLSIIWLHPAPPEFFPQQTKDESSRPSEAESGAPAPPSRRTGFHVRQCYTYMNDRAAIKQWRESTEIDGYGKVRLHNRPDEIMKSYHAEPCRKGQEWLRRSQRV